MKKYIALTFISGLIILIFMASKPNQNKFGPHLTWSLENNAKQNYTVYIYFQDKGPDAKLRLSNPLSLVTQRSLDRRAKVLPAGHLVEMADVPVYGTYLNEISSKVLKIRNVLNWFNAVSAEVNRDQLYKLAESDCVNNIEIVETFLKRRDDIESKVQISDNPPSFSPQTDSLYYGNGITQISQIHVNDVHNLGDFGQGVMIASFDDGFLGQTHEVFTTLPLNLVSQYDFQLHIPNAYSVTASHGTETMSLVSGYKPGQMIGPAFRSMFIVARTEVDSFERPIEMDNWTAAAQWADSLGADVITSSLGYLAFDAGYGGYTWQDMNGHTMPVTIAAALAAHHGIVVCNSAGNNYNGIGSDNTLNGPADADSINTIGAVDATGVIADFSSQGPTTDVPPRIKPDVCAMGENNYVAVPGGSNNFYSNGSGTSFSCPLTAGVSALILAANKNLTPLQVRGILRKFANNTNAPNNVYGWGIINAQQSVDSARKLDNVPPIILHTQPFTQTLNTAAITLKARVFDNGIIRYSRSGEAPRIYYRKNTGSGWSSYTSANFTSLNIDTFYFQIPGSALNTQVEYYFAAQDIALPNPLASTLPAGGSGINPPGTTAPSTRFAFIVGTSSIITNNSNIPEYYKLFENYPNPFNPSTNIRFLIKNSGNVTLKVFDIEGRLISTLVNQKLSAGDYTVKFDGVSISSGLYFYRIESGVFVDVKKMMFIK